MITIWTGEKGNVKIGCRRGNNLRYAAKQVANNFDATIAKIGDLSAILHTPYGYKILVMLEADPVKANAEPTQEK